MSKPRRRARLFKFGREWMRVNPVRRDGSFRVEFSSEKCAREVAFVAEMKAGDSRYPDRHKARQVADIIKAELKKKGLVRQ